MIIARFNCPDCGKEIEIKIDIGKLKLKVSET
jgi:predicted RNA-binding Zn-ribbon protein involved in translation (DUF1610 family)